jgi:anti-anti-sigma factor
MNPVRMASKRTIIVVGLPERLTREHTGSFLIKIAALLNADRTRIVFDCSQVLEIDRAGTDMLLHCVEQIIRQDGELTLSAVPPKIVAILELTCINRLFDMFQNNAEAVESYKRLAA